MIHEAIYKLYPNVKIIREDKEGTITALTIDETKVTINMDDVYGLRYSQLIAPLIKAVQELSAKVTELEQEETNKKETKVSAYRKMDMTDEEIIAIDPTLKEYL